MDAEQVKTEELTAMMREIRERVRSRHPGGAPGPGNIALPDLMPIVHARDAAEAKVASIGMVNPRAGGLLNSLIQGVKKLVSRALDWHVREQVEFNRAAVACVQATLEVLEESNRALAQLAGPLAAEARELKDVRTHWAEWRAGWEEKLNRSEVYMLRTISELNSSFQHRATLTENEFRLAMREQHGNYNVALDGAGHAIQERLWADLERIRREYEELIHTELRVVRQRVAAQPSLAPGPEKAPVREQPLPIDWLRFADRFRGSEEQIRRAQSIYVERFAEMSNVLDIGCGRGEFLEAAKNAGIPARGIDRNEETVALCRAKGLDVEAADLFEYLDRQPDSSLGSIYCAQVIEHLEPARLPIVVRLAAAKVKRGGLVAFETPNPESLAIFATHFYLDPTHTRPVPAALMAFYLEEAGFGRIEVIRLSPATECLPALNELGDGVRNALFGALDYAIFATRL